MIGVPTGEASGLWVLDVDRADNVDGSAALFALEDQYDVLPDISRVLTPRGGLHYYFKWQDGIPTRRTARSSH